MCDGRVVTFRVHREKMLEKVEETRSAGVQSGGATGKPCLLLDPLSSLSHQEMTFLSLVSCRHHIGSMAPHAVIRVELGEIFSFRAQFVKLKFQIACMSL